MANRWGNNENSDKPYFLVFQNHCRWWLQPWNWKTLAPWKKSYDQPRQHIKKQRHTLQIKVRLVKAMVFPEVMCRCESWTIKKAEPSRIDAFKLWYWRRLLRVPWKARRSHQSILKEISPEYSLERLMLKLKLQYFGYLMRRADSLENRDAGKDWRQQVGDRGWDGWVALLTQWTWVWASFRNWWWTGKPPFAVHGVTKSQTWLGDWTTTKSHLYLDSSGLPWWFRQ